VTPPSDLPDEMRRFPSPHDADRLLAGAVGSDDLPDEARGLAGLLSGLRNAAAPTSSISEQTAIAAITTEIRSNTTRPTELRRRRTFASRVPAKAGVAAFALVLVGGTAAAAATGSLPDPAQRIVSSALAHVNVSVPGPNEHANAHASSHSHGGGKSHDPKGPSGATGAEGAKGPDATGVAAFGLCTAASNGASTHSVAASNLEAAATKAGMTVADYCAGVTHPGNAGDTTTSTATTTTIEPSPTTPTSHPQGPPTSTPNSVPHPTQPTTPTTVGSHGPTGSTGSTGSSGSIGTSHKAVAGS
jgi:hypothetical protein